MTDGWFKVKRGITKHPIFVGRPERLAVWLWLLDNVAWADTSVDVRGRVVQIRSGSVSVSERRISEETGVGYQVVRTLLGRLETEGMITQSTTQGRKVITLCNWGKYQHQPDQGNAKGNATLTQSSGGSNALPNAAGDQASHGKQTEKRGHQDGPNAKPTQPPQKSNAQKEEDIIPISGSLRSPDIGPPEAVDDPPPLHEVDVVAKALWAAGKEYLGGKGVSNPGGVIGRFLKEKHKPAEILDAIQRAQKAGTEDPVPFMQACLRREDDAKGGEGLSASELWRRAQEQEREAGGDDHVPDDHRKVG
jgi:hypothetical protein